MKAISKSGTTSDTGECDECGEVVVGIGGDRHCDYDANSDCEGYVQGGEGPMMNYYYPLPDFEMKWANPNDAAKAIADLPLCLVEFTGNEDYSHEGWALALTGGGIDMSWRICEAYIRLGFYPPVHFCELPKLAGKGKSEEDQVIVAACIKSCEGMEIRMRRVIHKLNDFVMRYE